MLFTGSIYAQGTQTFDHTHPSSTWNTTTANWSGGTWINNNNAIFDGTGKAVDIDASIIANAITFSATNYVLQDLNGTAGSLTLSNGAIVTVTNSGDTAEINESISGSAWIKDGSGTLYLTGDNSFTGALSIAAGTLKLGHANALGPISTTQNHSLALGATLDLNGFALSPSKSFTSFLGTLINSSTTEGVIVGQVGPSAGASTNFTIDGTGDIRLSNVDRSIITKNGTGTLTLDGSDDNNAASLIVNSGLVLLAKNTNPSSRALGSSLTIHGGVVRLIGTNGDQIYMGVSPTINGTGVLDLNGKNESLNALQGNGGRIVNDATGSNITLGIGENNGSGTYHGIIANNSGTGGTLALRKTGRGTQTLTNQNTYSGLTTVNNGGLTLDFALTEGSSAANNILNSVTELRMDPNGNLNTSTFTINGEASIANSQTVSGLSIQGTGRSRLIFNAGSGGSVDVHVGAINHTVTSLVDFSLGANTTLHTTSTDGAFSSRATFNNGQAFAQIQGGKIAAYYGDLVYQTGIGISALSGYNAASMLHIDNTSTGYVLLPTSTVINAILVSDTAARTMDIGAGNTLQLSVSGTVLRNSAAGTLTIGTQPNSSSITAGTAANTNLVFNNANTAGHLSINSQIQNNAVGTVNLIVTGASGAKTYLHGNNTYTGNTFVHAGNTLRISSNTALGTTAAGTELGENAALELEGNLTIGNESLRLWGQGIGNAGSLRNISGNSTYGGAISIVNATGRITSNSGKLTLDVASGNAIIAGNMEFYFAGAGDIAVMDSITQGGTNNSNIYKDGAGTLTLAGNNTFSGTGTFLIRNSGRVIAQHNNALGGNSGRTQIESSSTLELQNNITTNENIIINTLGQSAEGAIISGSGSNTITGTITVDNSNTRIHALAGASLTLNNTTAAIIGDPSADSSRMVFLGGDGNITVAGAGIKDGAGSNSPISIIKEGLGTLTLSGANQFTGSTTVNNGTLALDYSNNSSKLSDSAALTLRQSILTLANGSHAEVVASTVLGAGTLSKIRRTSGTSTLNLNTITVETGAQLSIETANIARTDNLNTNGILGAWATINDTDWAINSTNSADGLITAFSAYSDLARLGGTINDNSTANYRIIEPGSTSGNIALSANTTQFNTLLMSAAGSVTPSAAPAIIDTTDKALRAGVSGGIMITQGSNGLTIGTNPNAGTLTAGGNTADTAGTLALINHSTTQNLVVNSTITNNGSGAVAVTKSGAGTLILQGNNTFSGGFISTAGVTKAIGSAQALGNGTLSLADSTLHLINNTSTDFNRGTTLHSDATIVIDRINAGAGVTHSLDFLTFTDSFTLTVLKGDNITSGTAGLVFDGRHTTGLLAKPIHSTFDLGEDVELTLSGSVSSGSAQYGNFTKNGAGKLILDNTRSYWENINIYLNQGKLEVRHAVALGDDGPANGAIHAANGTEVRLINNSNSDFKSPLNVVGAGSSVDLVIDRANAGGNTNHTLDNLMMSGNTLHVSSGGNITTGRGSITFSGASTLGANSKIHASTADVHINGIVSGIDGSLEKLGNGLLSLNAANTYTGDTIVTAGTLQVKNTAGSATGSGHVTVKSGATLNGIGQIGFATNYKNITLENLSSLQVGTSSKSASGSAQQLSLSNSGLGVISLMGNLEIDLFTNANDGALNPLTSNDILKLQSDQSVTLSGELEVTDVSNTSTSWSAGSSWQIIDWSGMNTTTHHSGTFSSFDLPTLDAALFWDLSQLYTSGFITVSTVPEPSRALLVLLGTLALVSRRRRS